jgi:hypothetical protein
MFVMTSVIAAGSLPLPRQNCLPNMTGATLYCQCSLSLTTLHIDPPQYKCLAIGQSDTQDSVVSPPILLPAHMAARWKAAVQRVCAVYSLGDKSSCRTTDISGLLASLTVIVLEVKGVRHMWRTPRSNETTDDMSPYPFRTTPGRATSVCLLHNLTRRPLAHVAERTTMRDSSRPFCMLRRTTPKCTSLVC